MTTTNPISRDSKFLRERALDAALHLAHLSMQYNDKTWGEAQVVEAAKTFENYLDGRNDASRTYA